MGKVEKVWECTVETPNVADAGHVCGLLFRESGGSSLSSVCLSVCRLSVCLSVVCLSVGLSSIDLSVGGVGEYCLFDCLGGESTSVVFQFLFLVGRSFPNSSCHVDTALSQLEGPVGRRLISRLLTLLQFPPSWRVWGLSSLAPSRT